MTELPFTSHRCRSYAPSWAAVVATFVSGCSPDHSLVALLTDLPRPSTCSDLPTVPPDARSDPWSLQRIALQRPEDVARLARDARSTPEWTAAAVTFNSHLFVLPPVEDTANVWSVVGHGRDMEQMALVGTGFFAPLADNSSLPVLLSAIDQTFLIDGPASDEARVLDGVDSSLVAGCPPRDVRSTSGVWPVAQNELLVVGLDGDCAMSDAQRLLAVPEANPPATLVPWDGRSAVLRGLSIRDAISGEILASWEHLLSRPAHVWGGGVSLLVGPSPWLVHVFDEEVIVLDTATEQVRGVSLGAPVSGEPCSGDLDGDGLVEVVVVTQGFLEDRVVALDLAKGDTAWIRTMPKDISSGASCSTADLNGDGADEVLSILESGLYVLDGRTGETVFEDPAIGEATGDSYPVVADIDGDGSSEILVGSGLHAGFPSRDLDIGLWAYRHPWGALAAHPPVWLGSDTHGTDQLAGERIPASWWAHPSTDGHHRMAMAHPPCAHAWTDVVEVCGSEGVVLSTTIRPEGGAPSSVDVIVQDSLGRALWRDEIDMEESGKEEFLSLGEDVAYPLVVETSWPQDDPQTSCEASTFTRWSPGAEIPPP